MTEEAAKYTAPNIQGIPARMRAAVDFQGFLAVALPTIDISLSTGRSDEWCEGVCHATRLYREALEAQGLHIAPGEPPRNQRSDLIIGEPGAPADVRLGMRLIGDDELATVTITQRNKTTTLAFTDSAHAARIADALLGFQPYAVVVSRKAAERIEVPVGGWAPGTILHAGPQASPAVQGEPVGEVRLDLGAPSVIYAELYSKTLPSLAPGTKLYTAPQPSEQPPFEWPLLDAPAMIGGATVGKGCSAGHVVAIAKRAYQYAVETSPEEHERRQRAFRETLAKIHQRDDRSPEDRWVEQETLEGSDALTSLQEAITQLDRWQSLVEPLQTHMEALQDLTGGVEGPLFDAINNLLIEHTKRTAVELRAPYDLLEDWWLDHRFGTEPMAVRIDGQKRIINTHRRLAWLILRCGVNE